MEQIVQEVIMLQVSVSGPSAADYVVYERFTIENYNLPPCFAMDPFQPC